MKIEHLTKQEFLSKIADYQRSPTEWKFLGDKPAIIDFYAHWCGPCKSIGATLEKLAASYADQIVVYKVDTEVETELAAAFGIRSIPSLLFIPLHGNPQMAHGAMSFNSLVDAVEKVLLDVDR